MDSGYNCKMTEITLDNHLKVPICESCLKGKHLSYGTYHLPEKDKEGNWIDKNDNKYDLDDPELSRYGCKNEGSLKGKHVQCGCYPIHVDQVEHKIVLADYPDHPNDIVIPNKDSLSGKEYKEIDIWNYYNGNVVTEMIKELKDRNLFIGMRLKGQTGKPLYIRHPYDKKTEYIRINNAKEFKTYHSGRTVEYHVTMPASCPYYVIDFDAGEVPFSKTKEITADIADELDKLPEVRTTEIRYTGKRGFHILGWLKKEQNIDNARESLKKWLKEHFGDRDDIVIGESPKGKKGALGLSPMKLNGGQVAKYSLRITGLCCVEVPRAKLGSFEKTDAALEKVYKQLTKKDFRSKEAAARVITSFLQHKAWLLTTPFGDRAKRTEPLFQTQKYKKFPAPKDEDFARPGEVVEVLDDAGNWEKKPFSPALEKEDMVLKVHEKGGWVTKVYENGEWVTKKAGNIHRIINEKAGNIHRIINDYNPKVIRILTGYDNRELKPGYKGRFVIQQHSAEKAGDHWDVRLEFPVRSLVTSLKKYTTKRRQETDEPFEDYPDEPNTVLRSFVTKKKELPTANNKIYLIETEDHPIDYINFEGEIKEGYGKGTVKIWDHGTYNLLDVEGDEKYVINFNGKKVKGTYALIKFKDGFLWLQSSRLKEAVEKGTIKNRLFRQLTNFQKSVDLLSHGKAIKEKESPKKLKKQLYIITDSIRSIEKALSELQNNNKES